MTKKSKNIIQYTVSVVLLILSLFYAFRNIEFSKVITILKNANYFWVLVSIPIIILSHWLRATRWRIFLNPIKKPSSTTNLFSAVMIGYLFNNLTTRLGEVVRPLVYSKREKVSLSAVGATIIFERFVDLIFLIGLFGLVFLFNKSLIAKALPKYSEADYAAMGYMVAAGIAFILIITYTRLGHFLLKIAVKPYAPKLYEKADSILTSFARGFDSIKSPSAYLRIILESGLIWLFYALPMYIMFHCFDFQAGLHLGIPDALILLVVSGVGVSIAPTPGAIGVYHTLVQVAMVNLYGLGEETAMAYAILVHFVNLVIQVALGGIFLLRENLTKIPSAEDLENEFQEAQLNK